MDIDDLTSDYIVDGLCSNGTHGNKYLFITIMLRKRKKNGKTE